MISRTLLSIVITVLREDINATIVMSILGSQCSCIEKLDIAAV